MSLRYVSIDFLVLTLFGNLKKDLFNSVSNRLSTVKCTMVVAGVAGPTTSGGTSRKTAESTHHPLILTFLDRSVDSIT